MTEIWFKVVIGVAVLAGMYFLFTFQDKQIAADRQLAVFQICMNTIRVEVLRDAGALKANLVICKEISEGI